MMAMLTRFHVASAVIPVVGGNCLIAYKENASKTPVKSIICIVSSPRVGPAPVNNSFDFRRQMCSSSLSGPMLNTMPSML